LCVTADENKRDEMHAIARECGVSMTEIGRTETRPGIRCVFADGRRYQSEYTGFDHFR